MGAIRLDFLPPRKLWIFILKAQAQGVSQGISRNCLGKEVAERIAANCDRVGADSMGGEYGKAFRPFEETSMPRMTKFPEGFLTTFGRRLPCKGRRQPNATASWRCLPFTRNTSRLSRGF